MIEFISRTSTITRRSNWVDASAIARDLDREADFELAHGHYAAAERLSRQAEDLREGLQ